jgi:hypothetical protein
VKRPSPIVPLITMNWILLVLKISCHTERGTIYKDLPGFQIPTTPIHIRARAS